MNALQALIWDMDGTLADTERDGHRVAFNQAFAQAGLKERWSVKHYGELLKIAGGKERLAAEVQSGGFTPLSEEKIRNLHQEKTRFYQKLIQEGNIPLRSGVQRLCAESVQEDVKLAIATTSAEDSMNTLVECLLEKEILGHFKVRAAGDVVAHKKPAPDIYLHALKCLKLSASNALAIEDSVHGLHAAKSAGLSCIVTVNEYTRHHDFSGADLVVSSLGDPEEEAIEVFLNPHELRNLHHVSLEHLRQIIKATS